MQPGRSVLVAIVPCSDDEQHITFPCQLVELAGPAVRLGRVLDREVRADAEVHNARPVLDNGVFYLVEHPVAYEISRYRRSGDDPERIDGTGRLRCLVSGPQQTVLDCSCNASAVVEVVINRRLRGNVDVRLRKERRAGGRKAKAPVEHSH